MAIRHALTFVAAAALVLGGVALGAGLIDLPRGGDGGPGGRRGPQARQVVVMPAPLSTIDVTLEAVGTARANESVVVTVETPGLLRTLSFEDGDEVARGAVLARLDSATEQAELARAEAALEEAQRTLTRTRDLRQRGTSPQAALDAAQAEADRAEAALAIARTALEKRTIAAPFAGTLGFRMMSPGAFVRPGDPLVTLDDLSKVEVAARVPEAFLGRLERGQRIEATSRAHPGRVFAGTVATVGSRVDPVTRQVEVRAEIDNPEGLLRPGMLLSLRLVLERREAVMVPEAAIVPQGPAHFMFVVGPENKAQRRRVQLGIRRAADVEILSGVAAGEPIVVDGAFRVADGEALAPQALSASPVLGPPRPPAPPPARPEAASRP